MSIKKYLGLIMGTLTIAVTGCASQSYQAGGPARRVLPSHGWHKPGVSPKEVYEARQACAAALDKDPGYQAALEAARKIPSDYTKRTKEEERIDDEPIRYSGRFLTPCLENQGFVYGKIKPEEVYVPPPPPKWDWVKEGVSESVEIKEEVSCRRIDDEEEAVNKCMSDKGFKWVIVDPHPASRL